MTRKVEKFGRVLIGAEREAALSEFAAWLGNALPSQRIAAHQRKTGRPELATWVRRHMAERHRHFIRTHAHLAGNFKKG